MIQETITLRAIITTMPPATVFLHEGLARFFYVQYLNVLSLYSSFLPFHLHVLLPTTAADNHIIPLQPQMLFEPTQLSRQATVKL